MNEDPSARGGERGGRGVGTDRERIDADGLFGALSKAPNRYVLYYLIRADRPVSTNELIEYTVAAVESPPGDRTTGELRGETRGAVERALSDLDAMGLLAYHAEDGVVEPTADTRVAEPYLVLALGHLA